MPNTSKTQNKAIPIQDYAIPLVKAKGDTSTRAIDRKIIQDVSKKIYPDPVYRPPPKPVRTSIPEIPGGLLDIDPELNTEFKENSSFQEGMMSEMYQRPDKSYFKEPQELEGLINTGRLIQKFLLKQADIDKILKIIQRKVLKGTHLPVTVNEIQSGYLIISYFKDIYLFLAQNKWPNTKTTIQKLETLAERYILLDSLLFKIITTPEKETTLLALSEVCVDKIIMLYHSSLFAGHKRVIQTYLTISDKFFIPGLIHYLCLYIKGCHIYQLSCNDKPPTRQLQTRIN